MKSIFLSLSTSLFSYLVLGQPTGFYEDTIRNCPFKNLKVTTWSPNLNDLTDTALFVINRNYYEFNSLGKLTFEKVGVGYSLIRNKTKIGTYHYDSLGRRFRDTISYPDRIGSPKKINVYTYSGSNNIVSQRDTYENNVLLGSEIKEFNNKGQLTRERFQYLNAGKPYYDKRYDYYDNGKLKTKLNILHYDPVNPDTFRSFFTYYPSGLTKSEIENDNDTTYFFYDENQILDTLCFADSSGSYCNSFEEATGTNFSEDSIYYGPQGNKFKLTKWRQKKEGKVFAEYLYEFDERENWIKKTMILNNVFLGVETREIIYWE